MNFDNKKKNFSRLSEREKLSKLNLIVKNKVKITVWEKGKKNCKIFEAFDLEDKVLKIKTKQSRFAQENVLYFFDLKGLSFFGIGRFIYNDDDDEDISLDCSSILYKLERRLNFRMLSFPHHNIYLCIKTGTFESQSNVIELKLGRSIDDLFREFLEQINDKDDVKIRDGYVPFRVMDMSIGGLSLHISELEKDLFVIGKNLGKVYIIFNGEEVSIPDVKIVYLKKIKSQTRNLDVIKVGVQFLEVDSKIEHKLGHLVYDAVREFTSEFENFIL